MSEMVERVATALIAEIARQIRAGEELALGNNPRLLARAAIEAMREPTDAMISAGLYEDDNLTAAAYRQVFRAMIDAELA